MAECSAMCELFNINIIQRWFNFIYVTELFRKDFSSILKTYIVTGDLLLSVQNNTFHSNDEHQDSKHGVDHDRC